MHSAKDDIFQELKQQIDGDLFYDDIHLALLSFDASIFQVTPEAVLYPKHTQDVVAAVRFATVKNMSVHSRGSGSGLCGSAIGSGIIIDFSRYMNVLINLDEDKKTFTCEPGYRFGELQAELKGKPIFFPPDPSSGEYASFGGMYATNASGAHSVKYGNVSDYAIDAEIVLSDGSVHHLAEIASMDYGQLPDNFRNLYDMYIRNGKEILAAYPSVKYNVTGYNLKNLVQNGSLNLAKLLGGSEGTLAIITRLTFKLLDKPDFDSLVVAFFDDIVSSAKAVQHIMPMNPSGIEVMDKSLLALAKQNDPTLRDKIPDGIDNVLLIEFDGYDFDACKLMATEAQQILKDEQLTDKAYLAISAEEKAKYWGVRKAAVPILYKLKGDKKILALIEDAAVPIENLVPYFEGVYALLDKYKVDFVVYGHIAKGLMHTRPLLNLKEADDVDLLKIIADEFFTLISSLGGVVSGEHGDGRIRSCYIKKLYGDTYKYFLQTKSIFDSANILNPEIKTKIDPVQVQQNLRYGVDYSTVYNEQTFLEWPENFITEIEKCHGCSKCTTVTTATRMCPIYKFTRNEMAAPKAKMNILRTLISGQIDDQYLYKKSLQFVLDHCVNCGSCYKECPSNVNTPKLAIEAKAAYMNKFGVPLDKKIMTGAESFARYIRKFSGLLGRVMEYKMPRKAMEIATGVTAERKFVTFAFNSLRERNNAKKSNRVEKDLRVLYFAGCYAMYIKPEIGEATMKVLDAMDVQVELPEQHCCGVPMLSKGMAKEAKAKVQQNLDAWSGLIDSVDHIVVSCSSCGLSLMQEWQYLMDNEMIRKVKDKTIHITSFINKYRSRIELKHTPVSLAYHMPCHLKIQEDPECTNILLSSIDGIEMKKLDSHCCGIAGSWGISNKNYDLSVKIGEDLNQKVNESQADYSLTDCPTCTMQMEHMNSKKVKHPVEILLECLS